ncbi:lactonase family protein [Variovorax ureilyticus]|uniref:Lactonase family protein n=1 Tax=Variovorax ureilyticus TaxID=1836198 RepID=A0ABU8VS39_9BURK
METIPNFDHPDVAYRAFVGCRTTALRNARGRGIEVFDVSSAGRWTHRWTVPAGDNPSYLLLDEQRRALHCVHGDGGEISSFKVDVDGRLHGLGMQSTRGTNPVHLATSACKDWVVVANYASGSVVSLPIQEDGSLGPVAHLLELPAKAGPHRTQQRGAHPHQVVLDPSGQWFLVPDKGADGIHTVAINEATGELRLVSTLEVAPGSGPRHLVFRTDGVIAWVVLELSSQVLRTRFDASTGRLEPIARTTTVPDCFTGENTGAGIGLSRDERHLLVSNRGHGSVVRYDVSPTGGALSSPTWTRVQGTVPRFISPLPDSDALCVANEDADSIVSVAGPSLVERLATTGSPVCFAFTHPSKGNP